MQRLLRKSPKGGVDAEWVEESLAFVVQEIPGGTGAERGAARPHRTTGRAKSPAGHEPRGGASCRDQKFRRSGASERTESRRSRDAVDRRALAGSAVRRADVEKKPR